MHGKVEIPTWFYQIIYTEYFSISSAQSVRLHCLFGNPLRDHCKMSSQLTFATVLELRNEVPCNTWDDTTSLSSDSSASTIDYQPNPNAFEHPVMNEHVDFAGIDDPYSTLRGALPVKDRKELNAMLHQYSPDNYHPDFGNYLQSTAANANRQLLEGRTMWNIAAGADKRHGASGSNSRTILPPEAFLKKIRNDLPGISVQVRPNPLLEIPNVVERFKILLDQAQDKFRCHLLGSSLFVQNSFLSALADAAPNSYGGQLYNAIKAQANADAPPGTTFKAVNFKISGAPRCFEDGSRTRGNLPCASLHQDSKRVHRRIFYIPLEKNASAALLVLYNTVTVAVDLTKHSIEGGSDFFRGTEQLSVEHGAYHNGTVLAVVVDYEKVKAEKQAEKRVSYRKKRKATAVFAPPPPLPSPEAKLIANVEWKPLPSSIKGIEARSFFNLSLPMPTGLQVLNSLSNALAVARADVLYPDRIEKQKRLEGPCTVCQAKTGHWCNGPKGQCLCNACYTRWDTKGKPATVPLPRQKLAGPCTVCQTKTSGRWRNGPKGQCLCNVLASVKAGAS